jgi:hypothetical protein
MSDSQSLLPEFDHEMASTRKVLERIPGDKLGWKVHEKSNTIGWVGVHLADIPGWTEMTLTKDSLDIAPPRRRAVENADGRFRDGDSGSLRQERRRGSRGARGRE